MRKWIWIGVLFILAGCSNQLTPAAQDSSRSGEPAEREEISVKLDNYGTAPELENEVWLNTDEPLRLANLRGKVVLLEMWTFG